MSTLGIRDGLTERKDMVMSKKKNRTKRIQRAKTLNFNLKKLNNRKK